MTVGEALAEARLRAGLTVDEVSERTRIREAVIRCIEQDDYEACGGDLYVRGYVRAIAGAVGIDAQPLIRDFDASRAAVPGGAQGTRAAVRPERGASDPAATMFDLPVTDAGPDATIADPAADPDVTIEDPDVTIEDPGCTVDDPPLAPSDSLVTLSDSSLALSDSSLVLSDSSLTFSDSPFTPSDSPFNIADPPHAPTDPGFPAVDPQLTIIDPEFPVYDPGVTASDPWWTSADSEFTAADPGFPAFDRGFTMAEWQYSVADSGVTATDSGFTTTSQDFSPSAARPLFNGVDTPSAMADSVLITPEQLLAAPAAPAYGQPRDPSPWRARIRGRRWLTGIIILVALALAAAGVAGSHIISSLRHSQAANSASSKQGAGTKPAVAPSKTAAPAKPTPSTVPSAVVPVRILPIALAEAFGPAGTTDGDNPQIESNAIAHRPASPWQTDWYATPNFGQLKRGTGLLLDMGKPVTITSISIDLSVYQGADLQLRAGNTAVLDRLRVVKRVSGRGGTVRLVLAAPVRARYLLIWFTLLPPNGSGKYQESVSHVLVNGRP